MKKRRGLNMSLPEDVTNNTCRRSAAGNEYRQTSSRRLLILIGATADVSNRGQQET
jgi:hypothetical protein